jgi:hypothetical protein
VRRAAEIQYQFILWEHSGSRDAAAFVNRDLRALFHREGLIVHAPLQGVEFADSTSPAGDERLACDLMVLSEHFCELYPVRRMRPVPPVVSKTDPTIEGD